MRTERKITYNCLAKKQTHAFVSRTMSKEKYHSLQHINIQQKIEKESVLDSVDAYTRVSRKN